MVEEQLAREIITYFEGYSSTAYPDPGSGGEPYTIGYGTTIYPNGNSVGPNDTLSQDKAEIFLLDDISWINRSAITGDYYNKLSCYQKAALISFVYNLGYYYLKEGTLGSILRNELFDCVPDTLGLYVGASGNVLPGLVRRRKVEGYVWRGYSLKTAFELGDK